MKNNLLHLVLLLVLSACAQNEAAPIEDGTQQQSTTAQAQDYFEHKVQAEYAQHFELSDHGNYKLVKTDATFYPNGKQEEGKSRQDIIVLVQKGTEAPPLTGALQDAQVVFIPIDKVAVNVQHSESFLRELGLVERINTIGGLYSFDDTMRNKALNGELGQVGYSWHSPPNIEVLLERQPEVFLMTLASMDHTQSLEKCRQLGIPTVAVFDWAEQDYQARAEWV